MPKPERTAIYRLHDRDERLLYVGIAKNLKQRWQGHELTQRWWHLVVKRDVTWLDSREEALAAEAAAVENEAPLYNAIRLANGSYEHLQYDDSAEVQVAVESMRRELADGTLPPGAPIHLVQLARRYGVSAVSVMTALNHLPSGAITCRSNKRFVTDPSWPECPRPTGPRLIAVPHDWFERLGFPG